MVAFEQEKHNFGTSPPLFPPNNVFNAIGNLLSCAKPNFRVQFLQNSLEDVLRAQDNETRGNFFANHFLP